MQGLNPLTVQYVAFTPGHVLDRLGADQTALDATGLEGLKQRNPIHSRGFHRSRLDTTIHKPVGQGVQISRIGTKGTDQLLVLAVRHAGHDLMGANIHPSGVAVDLAHPGERTGFALGRS